MTSIRIAFAAALAVGALLAGGSYAQHGVPAGVSHVAVMRNGPVTCCSE